jgi:hypothetical protein
VRRRWTQSFGSAGGLADVMRSVCWAGYGMWLWLWEGGEVVGSRRLDWEIGLGDWFWEGMGMGMGMEMETKQGRSFDFSCLL